MKNMKKIVAALLVLTMVLALTGTAMAACKFKKGDYVKFCADKIGFTTHNTSKKSDVKIKAGSIAQVVCGCGDNWVKLKLTPTGKKVLWFKTDKLKKTEASELNEDGVVCIFITGGTNQSKADEDLGEIEFKTTDYKVKVTGDTWLRKTSSLACAKQEKVKKGAKLTYKGVVGFDNHGVAFYKVCYKGNIRWISEAFSKLCKK